MNAGTTYTNIPATITISGKGPPYTVSVVPSVVEVRANKSTPNPAQITYTLAEASIAAGFTLGGVYIKTPSSDIGLYSTTGTQLVFQDQDTVAIENYSFGFYYSINNVIYYFDPEIDNEEPE